MLFHTKKNTRLTQQLAHRPNLISYHQSRRFGLWTSCFLLCCSTNLELSYT